MDLLLRPWGHCERISHLSLSANHHHIAIGPMQIPPIGFHSDRLLMTVEGTLNMQSVLVSQIAVGVEENIWKIFYSVNLMFV